MVNVQTEPSALEATLLATYGTGSKLAVHFIRPAQSAGTPVQYRSLLKSWLEGSFCHQPPPPSRRVWSLASFSPGASAGAAAAGRALKPPGPRAASAAAILTKVRRSTPAAADRCSRRSYCRSEI